MCFDCLYHHSFLCVLRFQLVAPRKCPVCSHEETWSNCATTAADRRSSASLNVAEVAGVLLSGTSKSKVDKVSHVMGTPSMAERSFYKLQKKLMPIIEDQAKTSQREKH